MTSDTYISIPYVNSEITFIFYDLNNCDYFRTVATTMNRVMNHIDCRCGGQVHCGKDTVEVARRRLGWSGQVQNDEVRFM